MMWGFPSVPLLKRKMREVGKCFETSLPFTRSTTSVSKERDAGA